MKTLVVFLAVCAAGAAQTISGVVTDASSGVVAGAAVRAVNSATGFSRATLTDTRGEYVMEQLATGTYTIRVSKPGFREFEARGITLEVNRKARQDVRLAVGEASEKVTVESAVSPLQTEDSSSGYRMDHARIAELPLAARNVTALVTLGPGAIPRQLGGFVHDVTNDVQEGSRGSVALNPPINGNRSTMNAFVLDGASDTDRNTFAIAVYPPMEAVQEFHIQSSVAPAAAAQAGGATMDVVTRSGSRNWHGSAFEYFRHEKAGARSYFDDRSLSKPIGRQNQFGGSLGGPLVGKGTFFFGALEGLRGKQGTAGSAIVPEAAVRGGDFTGLNAIYDPKGSARSVFPLNQIPTTRIDPIATAYLQRFEPLPNSSSASGNYLDRSPNQDETNLASMRVDHEFGSRGTLTGRYTYNGESNRIAGSFPVLPFSERVRAQQATVGYSVGAARWFSESRVAFTRLKVFDVPESAFHENVAATLGLADPPTDPLSFGLPFFNATNYSMVTDSPSLPQSQRDNLWQVSEAVSVVRGAHTLKAGGEWLRWQMNYLRSNLSRGQYTYTGVFTSADGSGVGSGDPFADFLLGYPQQTAHTVGSGQAYLRQSVYAGYLQDDWRATRALTVNFGVRYEYASPYTEARQRLLNLDYSMLPKAPGLESVSGATNADRNNFAPRVGVAWQLPRRVAVFRAGYGVYFSPEIATEAYDLVLNNLSNESNQTQGDRAPVLTTRDGFAKTSASGFPSYFGVDRNARTPYVQQWHASLQRELPGRVLLEASYVGSKGVKLGRYRQFNTPAHVETGENLGPRPGDLQSLRTFPELGRIIQRQHIANSSYHSLQVKAEKNLSSRFSLLASFVWSKSIDDADSVIPGLYDSIGAQDERNLKLERGLSFFNVGRRISAGYVYRLPWRIGVSGTVTLQDGTPVNPAYFALDFANSGTMNRPNVVPGVSVTLPRSERTAERFFNPEAFTAPAPFTFGNAGRNTIPGPGNAVFDLAVQRQFRIRERQTVEVRAEGFNVLNHPNWGIPGPYPDFGPFFGKIFTAGEPRRMQVALRYEF